MLVSSIIQLYAITHKTSDYGDKFVVRIFDIGPGLYAPRREPFALEDTLEAARAKLPKGLQRLPRDQNDDPVIVESWV